MPSLFVLPYCCQRGNLPIHEAFRNGHANVVGWLIDYNPDLVSELIKEVNNEGMTCVALTSMLRRHDYNECVKLVTGENIYVDTEQDIVQRRIEEARAKMQR
jgi:hypothetical protein